MPESIIPTPELTSRFWSKVDASNGPDACWTWQASLNNKGYGRFGISTRVKLAHRVSWMLKHGAIADGMEVCHRCDTPSCVNPEHLFLGTHQDNLRDMREKGRSASGDRNGMRTHPERHFYRRHPEAAPKGEDHWAHRTPHLVPRGSRNGRAKLTELQVIEILSLSRSGMSSSAIGRQFGVSNVLIGKIVRGELWTHIPR